VSPKESIGFNLSQCSFNDKQKTDKAICDFGFEWAIVLSSNTYSERGSFPEWVCPKQKWSICLL